MSEFCRTIGFYNSNAKEKYITISLYCEHITLKSACAHQLPLLLLQPLLVHLHLSHLPL